MTLTYLKRLVVGLTTLLAAACEDSSAPTPAHPGPTDRGYTMLFFDFDDASLTQAALAGVRHIVSAVAQYGGDVCVTASTDRAGSDAYNLDLSRRRAEAVRNELIRGGVAVERITLRWHGERVPLVTTQDGVKEAQNRRVELMVYRPDGKACNPATNY